MTATANWISEMDGDGPAGTFGFDCGDLFIKEEHEWRKIASDVSNEDWNALFKVRNGKAPKAKVGDYLPVYGVMARVNEVTDTIGGWTYLMSNCVTLGDDDFNAGDIRLESEVFA